MFRTILIAALTLILAGCSGMTPRDEAIAYSAARVATITYIASAKAPDSTEARAERVTAKLAQYRAAADAFAVEGKLSTDTLIILANRMTSAVNLEGRDKALAEAMLYEAAFLYGDLAAGVEVPQEQIAIVGGIIDQMALAARVYLPADPGV